jgi:hypothetical protein
MRSVILEGSPNRQGSSNGDICHTALLLWNVCSVKDL